MSCGRTKLFFVTGKGGVGKSTLTAALASALSGAKARVGVLELEETRMSDFFGLPPIGYQGKKAAGGILFRNLNARDCFEEYAARLISKRALVFVKNRWVHHFIDATPGLKEILILGKITSLLEEEAFDFLLLDAPATGHMISLLQAPRIALEALRRGPLKATVEKILHTLQTVHRIRFLLVTRPENFIVHETLELHEHLRNSFPASPITLWLHGEEAGGDIPLSGMTGYPDCARPLVAILRAAQARGERQKKLLGRIEALADSPMIHSPWIDTATKETQLRKTLARELKTAVCKFFLEKNG